MGGGFSSITFFNDIAPNATTSPPQRPPPPPSTRLTSQVAELKKDLNNGQSLKHQSKRSEDVFTTFQGQQLKSRYCKGQKVGKDIKNVLDNYVENYRSVSEKAECWVNNTMIKKFFPGVQN